MRILVVNSGSSSIKFSVYETESSDPGAAPRCRLDGELSDIGVPHATTLSLLDFGQAKRRTAALLDIADLSAAMETIFGAIDASNLGELDAAGYRVVHPGPHLRGHQRITNDVLHDIEAAAEFAPLHDPIAVAVIREGTAKLPNAKHYACFDSVFHETMPESAFTYALPAEFRDRGLRRYGFHGLSCESIVRAMQAGSSRLPRRMVIAHLGSGCSVTAVIDGLSIDTTMGLTPTGGIVMGTRPGDLDPGAVLYLLRQHHSDPNPVGAVEAMLNQKAGLVALAELPNDMRVIEKAASDGKPKSVLALSVFTRSVTKAIGGFSWLMGGIDAIVFSGGIGEHDAHTRSSILADAHELGVRLDQALNSGANEELRRISAAESKVAIFVVPSQEDLMIAMHVARMAVTD